MPLLRLTIIPAALAAVIGSAWLLNSSAQETPAVDTRSPQTALPALDVGEGLEATLFAAEPLLLSPSNIDVDHLGRVWVCEVVNYRAFRNQHPFRKEGDRILILEDTNGDGAADKQTVFYQGPDIDSAHGICVLGDRVIVSANDKVQVFFDDNHDGQADRKETLFSGISGTQHDHGIHAFVFGPDGRLYFNFGNAGGQIKDKDGKVVVDLAGNEVAAKRQPYQEGMIFRCNLDGSNFETLGWNFRNNWEVAVDSFGTLWQSDNDDDGNRGVRINFVMEFGNYGYKDELTGAGWKDRRTGMETEIADQHWHQNDPGSIPNLLHTGAGSPTGILVYEGNLLPKRFHNQLIHCDAGPNIVRGYLTSPVGAGYKAEISNILHGARDQWFRPSDVCVAPDGSLIVADWYDPGVGGHKMDDILRGRLFRIAPPGSKYSVPKIDVSTIDGAVAALQSPNLAARQLAWTALHKEQAKAEPILKGLFESCPIAHFRARALWLLGQIEGRGEHSVKQAIADDNADIRITGLRLARLLKLDLLPIVKQLSTDPSTAVRRECAIALRYENTPQAAELWATLAANYAGGDRWLLEALGIAADGKWDACLSAWLAKAGGNWKSSAGRDIVWRSRSAKTPELLAELLTDPATPSDEIPRCLRAFDFQDRTASQPTLLKLAFVSLQDRERQNFINAEALQRLQGFDLKQHPEQKDALLKILDGQAGTPEFVQLVAKFNVTERYPDLLALAQAKPDDALGVEAIRSLLNKQQAELIRAAIFDKKPEISDGTLRALGNSADGRIAGLLFPVINDAKAPVNVRRGAVRAVALTRNGAQQVAQMAEKGQLDDTLKPAAAASLHSAQWDDIKQQAQKLFPLPPSKDNKPLPPVAELVKLKGDVKRGQLLFNTEGTCAKCHVVNGIGKEVGPNLSEIGNKLSRQALFDSILFPNAGISHNYETYTVVLVSGNTFNGLLVSDTADAVTIKGADAIPRTFAKSEIEEFVKQDVSLMPADLQKVLTAEDLVDIVEYTGTLKKAAQ